MDSQELDLELALDRVAGQLDGELRAHVEAFARAHAAGAPPPRAPDLAGRASTAAVGRRALGFLPLRARALELLRVVAPIVLERDAAVVAALAAPPTWQAWRQLAEARDAVARARFGRPHLTVIHQLAGASMVVADPRAVVPGPLTGWLEPAPGADGGPDVGALWAQLRAQVPAIGDGLTIVRSATARPRFFVVERGVRGVAVVPSVVASPAQRFAVLHELGHAVLALSVAHDVPRAIDEAAASVTAQRMEDAEALGEGWWSPLAAAARARRLAMARALDAIERQLADPPPELARPPWALWHDPGAQAAYVHAEAIADQAAASDLATAIATVAQAAAPLEASAELGW